MTVGETFSVRVRDERREPIENALVVNGRKEEWTDAAGRCRFTCRAPGFEKFIAHKPPRNRVEYEPGTTPVRAVPKGERGSRRRIGSRTR